jgi:hypothetical protein
MTLKPAPVLKLSQHAEPSIDAAQTGQDLRPADSDPAQAEVGLVSVEIRAKYRACASSCSVPITQTCNDERATGTASPGTLPEARHQQVI